jgi:hypothetical protein
VPLTETVPALEGAGHVRVVGLAEPDEVSADFPQALRTIRTSMLKETVIFDFRMGLGLSGY